MAKHGLWIGSLMGLLAVALGAFGAHGLQSALGSGDEALAADELAKRLNAWHVADRYLMYHALITVVVGIMGQFNRHQVLQWAMFCFVGGTAVFSGALYVLCLTGMKWFGMVAPIGGVTLMVGWLFMLIAGYQAAMPKKKRRKKEQTT